MITHAPLPDWVQTQVSLAPHTWWQIGGPADYFAEIESEAQLVELINALKKEKVPWCLIGRGTNILFDDAGFRGCVIRMGPKFSDLNIHLNTLTAQAGCWTPKIAWQAARAGLSGLEHTIGIPATLGGLVVMNGGSQRKGVGDLIESVRVLEPNGAISEISKANCAFAYRHSRFQNSGEVILSATIRFHEQRSYKQQRPELLAILRERNRKFPRKAPSCGSVFKSSPELFQAYGPPGKIIEDLGFKRKKQGMIQISPRHANFIVNLGNGSSKDVKNLVQEIYHTVLTKTGLQMSPEFQYCDPVKGFIPSESWL